MRLRWLAPVVGGLLIGASTARADDVRAEMARALEEQADVQPSAAALPVRSPIGLTGKPSPALLARERSRAPARAAGEVAANATEQARGLAVALARAARAASAAVEAAADQAAKARARGRDRPGRGLKR